MTKQLQDAYIVAASRTPIGKAPRGMFRNTRPDELLVHAIRSAVAQQRWADDSADSRRRRLEATAPLSARAATHRST